MARTHAQRKQYCKGKLRGHHKQKHAAFKKHQAVVLRRMKGVQRKLPGRGKGFWGNLWSAGKKKAAEIAGNVVAQGKEELKRGLRNVAGAATEQVNGALTQAKKRAHAHYQRGKSELTRHAQKFEQKGRSMARQAESRATSGIRSAGRKSSGFLGGLFGF